MLAVVYGEFLRMLRTSRGLSQGALAEVVGISQPNLSAYEQDRRSPTLDTLNRLVVACGFELAATDGRQTIYCPLPVAGWFPDEQNPPRGPDDPPDEPPAVTAATPMADRLRALMAALELAEAPLKIAEVVVAVHDHLVSLGVAHAFGGALALAYYAEPRGTIAIDVNVFVPLASAPEIVTSFEALGFSPEQTPEEWVPIAGVRLVRGGGEPPMLDLFFSLDERYDDIARRVRHFPFGEGSELPFLSAEDLALFKLSFGRAKDWVDLRGLAAGNPGLDVEYIEHQLIGLRGPTMYPRLARLRRLIRDADSFER